MKTLKDVVDFIRTNHKKLESWSYDKIALCVVRAVNHNMFAYSLDDKGNFTGIVAGEPENDKTIRVFFIYAPNNLKTFIKYFRNRFNNQVKLVWFSRRTNKEIIYE